MSVVKSGYFNTAIKAACGTQCMGAFTGTTWVQQAACALARQEVVEGGTYESGRLAGSMVVRRLSALPRVKVMRFVRVMTAEGGMVNNRRVLFE